MVDAEEVSLSESAELSEERQRMKRRRRRLIYSNDSGDIYVTGANTPDGFLAVRMKPVLGTQVDSVFYCTGETTMFSHQAKVGEVYGKYVTCGDLARNIEELKAAGTDTLELVIGFCHENDLEVFFTHRINDIHDSMDSCGFALSTWKREHQEYCMGRRGEQDRYSPEDPRYWWSSLDFEMPEVRDHLVAIIEDVLSRYDVDGIEIDYFRSPMFFRPNLEYKAATPEQVAIMTGFQRRVRELAYREGNRRGRPILAAARVPMIPAACLHVGIDIEGWLKEGLLDILTTGGGYVPFTMPTAALVELGHAHNVPAYPTLSASGFQHQGYDTLEGWCGAASNAWQAGADGIVLFNTFPREPQHPHFTKLGDPATLSGMGKLFAIDGGTVTKEGDLRQAIIRSQILPVELDSGGTPRRVNLPIGDDIASAARAGKLVKVPLAVQFGVRRPGDEVQLRLNGELVTLTETDPREGWVTYRPKPTQFRRGDNALEFRVVARGGGAEGELVVQRVELRVDYK